MLKVLVADDESSILETLEADLVDAGFHVATARDGLRAAELLKKEEFECLVTDLNMPGMNGMALLELAKKLHPSIAVVVVTGYATIESAVQAIKSGASEYVVKPFMNDQIVTLLKRVRQIRDLEAENRSLREQLFDNSGADKIVGTSEAMAKVKEMVQNVARSDSTVLITGETGTGKEVTAKTIHQLSQRRQGPFISLSCAAVPKTLLEDELFGHERGAFTDAREKKLGRFERAEGGTILLDDIDDVPLDLQVKLLRVLQEKEIERLGGQKSIKINVRVIAATKVDLRKAVDDGTFRSDLYFRLNVLPIRLPPLRQRRGDVAILTAFFIKKYGAGRNYTFSTEVAKEMDQYNWPGNVRELEHSVERAVALAGDDGVLQRDLLLPEPAVDHKKPVATPDGPIPLRDFLERAERAHIQRILESTKGHKAQAAALLGISRKSLWEKLKYYAMASDKDEGE